MVDKDLEGHTFLWRTEEAWQIMQRQTPFHNWFTKMCLGLGWQGFPRSISSLVLMYELCLRHDLQGAQLADAWRVPISVHFIPRQDYRGRKATVLDDRPRISFDGLTTPGMIFAVLWQ